MNVIGDESNEVDSRLNSPNVVHAHNNTQAMCIILVYDPAIPGTTAQADSSSHSANEHRLFILLPVGSSAAVRGVLPDHRVIKLHNSVYNDPLKQCW